MPKSRQVIFGMISFKCECMLHLGCLFIICILTSKVNSRNIFKLTEWLLKFCPRRSWNWPIESLKLFNLGTLERLEIKMPFFSGNVILSEKRVLKLHLKQKSFNLNDLSYSFTGQRWWLESNYRRLVLEEHSGGQIFWSFYWCLNAHEPSPNQQQNDL